MARKSVFAGLGQQVKASPVPPAAAVPAPAPAAAPFAGLAGQIPASFFASPEAQQYLQQSLAAPYMAGWGGPQAPGAAGGTAVPDTGPQLAGKIQVDPAIAKMAKSFRKAKKASGWGLKDLAGIAAGVGLTALTGGAASPLLYAQMAASGLSGAYAAGSSKKKIQKQLGKIGALKDQYLPGMGFTKTKKGGWLDSTGTQLSTPEVFQMLSNAGAFGG